MKHQLFRVGVRGVRTACLIAGFWGAGAVSAAALTFPHGAPDVISGVQAVSYTPDLYPRLNPDPCLAFLTSSLDQVMPGAAGEVSHPHAGQAAALSLALGVRYATGPLERPGPVPMRADSPRVISAEPVVSAGSIAAYRHCRKEHALSHARYVASAG